MASPANPAVSSIPEGYHTLTPYLVAQDAPGLINFVKQTFAAEETSRSVGSAGGIHAEVRVGDSKLMIGGGGPGLSWHGEARPTALHVYVEDTDAVYQRALQAGGESIQAPADQRRAQRKRKRPVWQPLVHRYLQGRKIYPGGSAHSHAIPASVEPSP